MSNIESLIKSALESKARMEKAHNTGTDKAVKDAEIDKKYKLEDFRMSSARDVESAVRNLSDKIRMFKSNVLSTLSDKGVDAKKLQDDIMKDVDETINKAFRGY